MAVRPQSKGGPSARKAASGSQEPSKKAGRRGGSPASRKPRNATKTEKHLKNRVLVATGEKARALKEKERLRQEKAAKLARAQALKAKQRERELLLRERALAKTRQLKETERRKAEQRKERERVAKERERVAKERERVAKERERERLRKQKEEKTEQARKLKEREARQEAERKAREAERTRLKAEREAERERVRLEREAERERVRLEREAERARREAEREAYRKAKEVERERVRAEREAARRALEGKVARATKRGQRGDGLLGRGGTTTRVYRPDAIPDQSGTTRRLAEAAAGPPLIGVSAQAAQQVGVSATSHQADPAPSDLGSAPGSAALSSPAPPSSDGSRPTPPPPPSLGIEERWARINERLEKTEISFQREYRESFDMSWIYHDSALEGVVYTFQELKTATDPAMTVVPDSSLQPVCEEIRRNRQAIELVRELSEKKRVPLNVDILKKIYVTLHPEEGDVKTVKYRKDIPQHRLYFHEYAAPDKIAYRVRQVIDWLNGPEPKKIKNTLRVAARLHYDLLRIFPFQSDSGKVVRLFVNIIMMRAGYPPAIIHSTERQKYYEALKSQLPVVIQMTNEAISNALLSIEKRLEEYEIRVRGATAS